MAALTIFLFWLFFSSGGKCDQSLTLRVPLISLSPSWGVSLGGNATITCKGFSPSVLDFYLEKGGQNITIARKMDRGMASFPILNVSTNHGGRYSCYYYDSTSQFWSRHSDPVELLIMDPALPTPTISFYPIGPVAFGGKVNIICKSQHWATSFYFHKAGCQSPHQLMAIDKSVAIFSISNASREHGGSYSCRFRPRSDLFFLSEPSYPIDLLITDPDLPRPNISLSPRGKVLLQSNIIIKCWAKGPIKRFFLHKSGAYMQPLSVEPYGDMATFHINKVIREDGGIYSCSYRPQSVFFRSKSSDPVELLVLDHTLLRPTIALSPTDVVAVGGNVTIHCQSKRWNVRFYLQKAGEQMPHLIMKTPWNSVKFLIANATLEDRGRYRCSYRLSSQLSVTSEHSESVELLVKDPDLPRPNISLSPSRVALLGCNITIHCWIKGQNRRLWRFCLHKAGAQVSTQYMAIQKDVALFSINNISRNHGGSYYCSYRQPDSLISSETSDPVELFVLDPDFPRPTISLSPTDRVALGGNVTIHCQSQDRAVRFFLQKAGDQMPPQQTETGGTISAFSINNASRKHGGRYHCSYQPESHLFLISKPSSSVELLITDPDLPRPNIALNPNRMAFLGSNTTIQCWVKGPSKVFYLHKPGLQVTLQLVESDGDMAVFSIRNVTLEDAGSYHCSYRPSSGFFFSEPSNNVELMVLDPKLPKPTISRSPSKLVALGGQVTFQCEIQDGPMQFYLHKIGDPTLRWPMKSDWDEGKLSISNISWEHQGNYCCSYELLNRRFLFSQHSTPLELRVSIPETLETWDSTKVDFVRVAIGGLILLLLTCILIWDQCIWREHGLKKRLPKKQSKNNY